MIVEHLTDQLGTWERSCSHVIEEQTAGPVEQFKLDGGSDHSTVARCMRCGEWVTIQNRQETLL